ncbi:MAG: DUF4276 family protein [Treponema sp.]|nr:DUF4276 family protein [Treponema sp.]
MVKIVFLLEESSMKELLSIILPQIFPQSYTFQCIAHNGKPALKKSIPIKTRGWKEQNVQFVIVCDKDSADCKKLKTDLHNLIYETRHSDTLIRIVCTELESWYLGDLDAVEKGYGISLSGYKAKAIFRNPDSIANAKQELRKLVPAYQQITGAKKIAQYMDITKNKSHSFNVFVKGIEKIVQENKINNG